LGDLVERHESLRTVFPETLGVPRQLILEALKARPTLNVLLVTEAILAEALATAAQQGFDLSAQIPLRVHLFALSQSEHVLLLVLHHIASDGWSLATAGPRPGPCLRRALPGCGTPTAGAAGPIC